MFYAVNGQSGYYRGLDYRYVDTMCAYTYLADLNLGIVVKPGSPLAQIMH